MSYLIFFGLLGVLYVLSHELTKRLSVVLYHVSKSQSATMYIIAMFFFPGVFVHELSHYIAALLVGVRAGKIEFFPKLVDQELKLGSVQIQATDPIRKTIIGVAPLFGGVSMLLLSMYLYRTFFPDSIGIFLLVGLLYFQIANTMFSSKKDLEGTGLFFLSVLLIGLLLWLFHIPVISFLMASQFGLFVQELLARASLYLKIAVGIDVVLLIILILLTKLKR